MKTIFALVAVAVLGLVSPALAESKHENYEKALFEALRAGDSQTFSAVLERAQNARFPHAATVIVNDLLFSPGKLPENLSRAARNPEMVLDGALYLALASRSKAAKVDKKQLRSIVLPYIGTELRPEYEWKA